MTHLARSGAALALALTCSLGPASALSDDDRAGALERLDETRSLFLAELEGLSDAQVRFQPAADKWSIGEIAEHLALAEELIFGRLTGDLMESPKRPEWTNDGAPLMTDLAIRLAVTNRTTRQFNAPPPIAPQDAPTTAAGAIERFTAPRERTRDWVEKTDADLRSHFLENPVLGMLDGYQWLVFLNGHVERHTAQAREVKESADYPGGPVR